MKHILLASAAIVALSAASMAADLPARAPAPVPVVAPAFTWSGIYVGAQVGYGWGKSRFDDSSGNPVSNEWKIQGAVGGGTVGFNYQFAPLFVAGIEGDLSASNVGGTSATGNIGATNGGLWVCVGGCRTELQWFGTARGRLGIAFDNVMLYGTGGWAFGNFKSTMLGGGTFYDTSDNKGGWTGGAGLEYAFTPNWSVKAEYLHMDLGWTSYNPNAVRSKLKADVARVGVNYRFSWGGAQAPVLARY